MAPSEILLTNFSLVHQITLPRAKNPPVKFSEQINGISNNPYNLGFCIDSNFSSKRGFHLQGMERRVRRAALLGRQYSAQHFMA